VDIVFEHVGAATWVHSVACLAHHGRLVTCGATNGGDVSLNLNHLFFRHLSLNGSFMGTMGELHDVLKLVGRRVLKPVIDSSFPLSELRAAHERIENKEQFGKIVLVP
jgi:NADPH:quinone reductase-like Zn-dependent oxidoreductase